MDDKKAISLLKINEPADGDQLGFTVEVPEEVEQWFMKSRGLTEWSDEKFNAWFKGLVEQFIADRNATTPRSDQQSVDIWESE